MSEHFDAITAELRRRKADPPAGKVANGEVYEWCPFHPDGRGKPPHRPSLRLNRNKEVWYCDPCAEGGTFIELAERLGLETDAPRNGRIIASYDYHDAQGNICGQVVRKTGKKFAVRRPDGSGGWVWNWRGITRTLYRLPKLLAADPNEWVFVVEGEKDADRLTELGLVATTNPNGANKWRPEFSDALSGRKVAVIPDNDTSGKKHGAKVARWLVGKAADVRIVRLPVQGVGEDVSDWLDGGGTREELVAMVEAAVKVVSSVSTPGIGSDATTLPAPVRAEDFLNEANEDGDDNYVLEDFIPPGTVTLLVSNPKVGKSRFARQLCRDMEAGGELCGKRVARGRALYLALEERPSDVRKHLRQLGARETLIFPRPLRMSEKTIALLTEWIRQYDLKLIVVDTLNRFWVIEKSGDRRQTDTALFPLVDIAHTMGVTVLLLHHLRKSGGEEGTDIAESNDILAIADQAVYLRRDGKHKDRRLLQAPGIGRYPPQPDLALQFNDEGIYVGLGEAEAVEADEEASGVLSAAAIEWLTARELAQATGMSEATIRRRVPPLVEKGLMDTLGSGKPHDPIRYKLVVASPPNSKGESEDTTPTDKGLKATDSHLVRLAPGDFGLTVLAHHP